MSKKSLIQLFEQFIFLTSLSLLFSCSFPYSPLPLRESFSPSPLVSYVFVGEGRAYRFSKNSWAEFPSYNYEFIVLQRRYENRWESIKEIYRRHPLYDGRAGKRDQTLYFSIKFVPVSRERITFTADTSLGKGEGHADLGFRNLVVELTPDNISVFAPFNAYRITQSYQYEDGFLNERVEIFKKKNGLEEPFMKIEERAMIYTSK